MTYQETICGCVAPRGTILNDAYLVYGHKDECPARKQAYTEHITKEAGEVVKAIYSSMAYKGFKLLYGSTDEAAFVRDDNLCVTIKFRIDVISGEAKPCAKW